MKTKTIKAWLLVTVERGFPSSVSLFTKKRDVANAERKFVKNMNPDYDECEVFILDLSRFHAEGRITVEA